MSDKYDEYVLDFLDAMESYVEFRKKGVLEFRKKLKDIYKKYKDKYIRENIKNQIKATKQEEEAIKKAFDKVRIMRTFVNMFDKKMNKM